jgi:hypothetical protein
MRWLKLAWVACGIAWVFIVLAWLLVLIPRWMS